MLTYRFEGTGQFSVLYDYTPVRDDEIALTAGGKVTVLERDEEGWARGTFDNVTGWFPANYIGDAQGEDLENEEKVSTSQSAMDMACGTWIMHKYHGSVSTVKTAVSLSQSKAKFMRLPIPTLSDYSTVNDCLNAAKELHTVRCPQFQVSAFIVAKLPCAQWGRFKCN